MNSITIYVVQLMLRENNYLNVYNRTCSYMHYNFVTVIDLKLTLIVLPPVAKCQLTEIRTLQCYTIIL